MELWVRSQDKDILTIVDDLVIEDESNKICTHKCIGDMQRIYTLGRYTTRERALEVLDDIQMCLFHNDIGSSKIAIYELPKE